MLRESSHEQAKNNFYPEGRNSSRSQFQLVKINVHTEHLQLKMPAGLNLNFNPEGRNYFLPACVNSLYSTHFLLVKLIIHMCMIIFKQPLTVTTVITED